MRWLGLICLVTVMILAIPGCAGDVPGAIPAPAPPESTSTTTAESELSSGPAPAEPTPTAPSASAEQNSPTSSTYAASQEKAASPAPPSPEPQLSEALVTNYDMNKASGDDDFQGAGIALGETAVNFTLRDTSGETYRLSRILADTRPVVMIFGSFT